LYSPPRNKVQHEDSAESSKEDAGKKKKMTAGKARSLLERHPCGYAPTAFAKDQARGISRKKKGNGPGLVRAAIYKEITNTGCATGGEEEKKVTLGGSRRPAFRVFFTEGVAGKSERHEKRLDWGFPPILSQQK